MNGDRRDFLRLAGAGSAIAMTGAMSGIVDRALAIPAARRTGTIMDVEHIVVHMQENRSFDHYFGMLNGVRGFGDPRALRLAGGRSVWSQPSRQHPDGYVMPYHGDSRTTRSFSVGGADQSHIENMRIFNRGRYDRWGHSEELHHRMLHYGAGDLPFYYALADAFTVCDAYHCSTMTQTYPNRMHLFTGCNGGGTVGGDPQMQNYGEDQTPSADMVTDQPLDPAAYGWMTYAERLQAAGIGWKVYQEYDNFGDNLLSVFPSFRPCARTSELYRRGRSWVSEHAAGDDRTRSDGEQLVAAFRQDIASGQLPQISWIVTAADLSEHPNAQPAKGEHVTAKLVEALIDHPDVFAKTVFILNYDEAGGFYDHMPPPVPPVGTYLGKSTIPLDGEAKDYRGSGKAGDEQHPIGLGIRTPAVIVSPWSRGGYVCSELFDHTSVLQFMEKRFGVAEPNISPWRRGVCGDLTSAFDFSNGQPMPARSLPGTEDFRERVAQSTAGTANDIPQAQSPTTQMSGQRAHRPLPYRIGADSRRDADGRLVIALVNAGETGVVLTAYDNRGHLEPRHYTIGRGDYIEDIWAAPEEPFDLTLHGPNGFWRRFSGHVAAGGDHQVRLVDHAEMDAVELQLENRGLTPVTFSIALDDAYPAHGARARDVTVPPGTTVADLWRLSNSANWYGLSVTAGSHAGWQYAGKVENGRCGLTDPAIGMMRI